MIVYTISDVIALVLLVIIMTGAVLFLIIGGIGNLLSKWSERWWKHGIPEEKTEKNRPEE